jgi:hypothetical protein
VTVAVDDHELLILSLKKQTAGLVEQDPPYGVEICSVGRVLFFGPAA